MTTVIGGIAGAFVAGAAGGAWGLAFGALVSMVTCWLHLVSAMRNRDGRIHTEGDRPPPFLPAADLSGPR